MKRREFLTIAGVSLVAGATGIIPGSLSRCLGIDVSGPGKKNPKWAMVIDMKVCAGKQDCRDCIETCHLIHNVPSMPVPKEKIRWIWQSPFEALFPEQDHLFVKDSIRRLPVLALCNHCDDPPCVKVCPTKATWKRKDGIVMMDYHRCIGCRYCMAACPYGARSFNWRDPKPFIPVTRNNFPTRRAGVVEKCNFCEERLWKGLLPACVEACKEKALVFGDLNLSDSPVTKILTKKYSIWRKPHLGTQPKVFYVL